ncbi:hypothetical protein QQP08_003031 [Theobroma cacao]|uniref:Uncharacterized protein n=1 Tax=Theobroma cacao TaxID=3641 RepID=A0A061DSZ8_THECC|nr:Uncharacterized protein TCM_005251 [Theobroma cacao]WRX10544.1 hypothetical protein QQP08_003031 [Theobroma cacao]
MAAKEKAEFLATSFNERNRDMNLEVAIRLSDEVYQQRKSAFYRSTIAAMLLLILVFVLVALLTRKFQVVFEACAALLRPLT